MNKDRTCAQPPSRVEVPARGAAYRTGDLGIGIQVDAAEVRSGLPELLRARGVSVSVQRLLVGDYAIGGRVHVERKEAGDFLHSMRSGRLFGQALKLSNGSRRPLILVEGDPYALLPDEEWGPLRGAVLSLMAGFGIPVLQTGSTHETAACLVHALQQEAKRARKRLRRREAPAAEASRARPPTPPSLPPAEPPPEVLALLAALPDVGRTRARAIAASLGSFANLASADLRRLLEIPGIGPQTAISIYEALRTHQAPQGAAPATPPERQSA